MPTLMHLHPQMRTNSTEREPSSTEKPENPDWVPHIFGATAILGLLIVVPLLLYSELMTFLQGNLSDQIGGAILLIGLIVVFWRQYQMKRWACAVGCLLAWGVAIALLVTLFTREGNLLLIIPILLAPAMTRAYLVGWRGLEMGF